jgi:hypothetical protein
MSTLTGQNIANTYKQLLQVGSDNTGLTSTVQTVQDGNGTNSALQLSQSAVNINGTFQLNGSTLTATASALNAVPNLTSYTGFIAVSSSSINGRTLTAGTGVSITNGNGTAGNPTIALDTTGVVSGSYGPATNFAVNAVGQIVSATAAASVSVSAVTANTFVGGTFEGTTANFSSNVSVGGNLIVDGQFTPAALSVTGTINAATISATDATFNNIVSAAYFVGDGSGLVNVPSAEGGTVKRLTAGPGISLLVNAVSSDITVSGTVQLSANISVSTVYANTNVFITGNPVLTSAGLATLNNAVTSINTVLTSVSARTSVNAAAITSINIVVANVSALTSVNTNAITSINSVVANVSALTSVNAAAITSINSVIDAFDFATSAELAAVSSALATSIATANTRITSVSDYAIALSATLATSIGNSNTNIAAVSVLTSINAAAITSINSVVANVSALTSVNSAAITSINIVVDAVSAATSVNAAAITSINIVVADLSSTLATSIANHLPLAGGTLTGIVSGTDFYVSAVAIGVDTLLGKQLHLGTAAVADIVSLTDGTSIAVDFNAGQNFAVQLAGNRTLESPTNCVAGQTGSIFVIQDGTGSRTLSYGGSWKFPAGTAPTLSTAISAVDRIDYIAYTSTAVHAIATLDVK